MENYWTILKEGSTWAHILGVITMQKVWSLERCDDQTRMQAEHTASAIRDEDALLAVSFFFRIPAHKVVLPTFLEGLPSLAEPACQHLHTWWPRKSKSRQVAHQANQHVESKLPRLTRHTLSPQGLECWLGDPGRLRTWNPSASVTCVPRPGWKQLFKVYRLWKVTSPSSAV